MKIEDLIVHKMPEEPVEWGSTLSKFVTASDWSRNSNVLADVPGLSWPVEANQFYGLEISIVFQSTSTSCGIGLAVVGAGTVLMAYLIDIPIAADGTSAVFHGSGTSSGDLVMSTAVLAANTWYHARITGLYQGVQAGDLKVQARSEVDLTAITIRQGSGGDLIPRSML